MAFGDLTMPLVGWEVMVVMCSHQLIGYDAGCRRHRGRR